MLSKYLKSKYEMSEVVKMNIRGVGLALWSVSMRCLLLWWVEWRWKVGITIDRRESRGQKKIDRKLLAKR